MNSHKCARLTAFGRKTLIERVHDKGLKAAAADAGVSVRTASKWLARFRSEGEAGLCDRSSRPHQLRAALNREQCQAAVALRQQRLTMRAIATALCVPLSTLRRWLASQGMCRLPRLDPPPPVRRYEHDAPGDLLHLDIKTLGRIVRPGHRVTGDPRDSVDGAGWECVHVAIDDHTRVGFSLAYPDQTCVSAIAFLRASVAYYAGLGVTIVRLLTDNGSAYRSKAFAAACRELAIKHRFTRPYTPRTNGKAERFIQTALREWAYAHTYANSAERQAALTPWMHRYNHHRPHSALGYRPPISRIPRNNLSNLNSGVVLALSLPTGSSPMNPRIRRTGNARWIALLLAGMAIADTVAAQSLSFDPSAAVLNGGAPAIVKPRFQAGGTAVSRYHMVFGFPAGVFPTVQSTQCLANATCTVDMALHRVVVARASVTPAALSDEVTCLLEFRGGGVLGAFPLQVVSAEFFDAADQPVAGTAVDGSVGVISGGGGPPTLDYVPAPDATCQPNASDEVVFDDAPPPSFAAVDLTTSAFGSPSGLSLSCSVGPGFSIVSGGEQAISSITPGVPIVLRCDQPAAGRGVLACTETSVSGTRPRIWDLACPRPVFADGMEAALR